MADSGEGAGFWLPSEFFDDFPPEKQLPDSTRLTEFDSEFRFPSEFPFDFAPKSDENFQKRRLMSTSPQSTLSPIGRSAGGSPTTPRNDVVGDLVFLAAGQVARLKLNSGDFAGPAKPGPPRSFPNNIYHQQQKQGCEMLQKMYAWPGQSPARIFVSGGNAAAGFPGAAAKKSCAGTGVFLPRRYGSNQCNVYSSDSRKRPGYSTPSIPNRNIHAMNKNFESSNGFTQSQLHYHHKLGRTHVPEYDLLMAQRNALLLQHQRSMLLEGSSPMNRGSYLPQEWTY